MAYAGILDDIQLAVELKVPKRVPFFAISEPMDVKVEGLCYSEYTTNPVKMARCRINAVKRFNYDWSCGWPDDYLEFEPLGVNLSRGQENTPLTAVKYPPVSQRTLKGLQIPDFQNAGRLGGYLDVLETIKQELGELDLSDGAGCGSFTAVALLFGVQNAMTLLIEDPQLYRQTMDFLAELSIQWGRAQLCAGAHALWVGDCVASSGFISPNQYREFAFDVTRRVIHELRMENAFVFYHAGESSLGHLELMADLNPSGLSVGGKIDLGRAKATLGRKVCLLGNIHGIATLQRGTVQEVKRQTQRIIEQGKPDGGYIFNSEEGIPRETPEENMKIMMETVRQYGDYE